MKGQIISRKKQEKLRKISSVLQAIVFITVCLIGCSNLDELEFNQLVVVLGILTAVMALLMFTAFFLSDVRRWYRIVIPTYAIVLAIKYNKFNSKKPEAIACGRFMKKHRYSYSDLFYRILDDMDEIYGEPDNTTI